MQKREIAWIVILLLLIGAYIRFFGHWGETRQIQIVSTIRPMPQARRRGPAAVVTNVPAFFILFSMDNYYRLTSVKVTAVNRHPTQSAEHILWHLVSKVGSPPLKVFQYAQALQNMDPYLPSIQPEPLVPGETYRLEVSAGKLKGVSPPFSIPPAPQ
jgi:hypothetical protein